MPEKTEKQPELDFSCAAADNAPVNIHSPTHAPIPLVEHTVEYFRIKLAECILSEKGIK